MSTVRAARDRDADRRAGKRQTPRIGHSPETAMALADYALEHTELLGLADLDPAGRIVAANGVLERLAGRPLAGAHVGELVTPAQREALEQALAEAGPAWSQRLLGMYPDSRGVPLDFIVSLRRGGSGWMLIAEPAQAAVSAVNDWLLALNEELTRAQRQINQQNAALAQHNDRLRELDELKDVLLANVSHDLRTPLTAILGYAELMRRRGCLPANHARAVEVIERNARRLLRLVNDLLVLAQARAGELRLELETVDLAQLARDASELAQPLADQGHLALDLSAPAAGAALVRGDRLRLAQLIDNLVSNAIKFTPPGGRVRIGVRAGRARVALTVQDDGPGMSEADQSRLFDAFTRGSLTAAVPGTGLGLTIVRTVADAHGAKLELRSKLGEGTKFTVRLPREAAATLTPGPPVPRTGDP
jgi:signal transduction histidine kinase